MNVTLKPEIQKFVDEQVGAGVFSSPQELVEAGIARLMLDPQSNDFLDADDLAAIEESEAQIARGDVLDWKKASAQLRKKHLGE
jgi:Arc/MetJ-type ribon-helix-helix transcriptional regulator